MSDTPKKNNAPKPSASSGQKAVSSGGQKKAPSARQPKPNNMQAGAQPSRAPSQQAKTPPTSTKPKNTNSAPVSTQPQSAAPKGTPQGAAPKGAQPNGSAPKSTASAPMQQKSSAPKSTAPKSSSSKSPKSTAKKAPAADPLSLEGLINAFAQAENEAASKVPAGKEGEPARPQISFDDFDDDFDDDFGEDISADDAFDDDFDDDIADAESESVKAEAVKAPEVSKEEPKAKKSDDKADEPKKIGKWESDSADTQEDAEQDTAAGGIFADDEFEFDKPTGVLESIRSKLLSSGEKTSSDSDKTQRLLVGVILLLTVIIVLFIIVFLIAPNCGSCGTSGREQSSDWFDQSAVEGTLPGKTPEEIQAMLDQIVEEGMFNVSIAPVILFESPQSQGKARIENVPANHYYMSVTITLDDTGKTVYQSKGIKPGQYIEYITLQSELSPGEYPATAIFTAYDADTLEEQGRVAVKISIYVEG